MEEKFVNKLNKEVYYISHTVENAKANVVIAHGMAEHPARYDNLAYFLNNNNINVYAIYHIGHGKYADKLGHFANGEFDECVSNVNELVELVKKGSDKPVILLGHSMGSFMSQTYITRYNNIDALILSGSSVSCNLFKIGSKLASLICVFSKDISKESKLLDKLSFGSYNSKFKKEHPKFAWLNRDISEVIKYENDPYCGFICTKSFYKNLMSAMANMANKKAIININKDLPILLIGGDKDPVSSYGKGLIKLAKQYSKLDIKDVTLKLYKDGRHEMYLELNKDEVYKDTLDFINKIIA